MLWCIQNSENLYWHNKAGWVEDCGYNDSFATYTDEEKNGVRLPMDGRWVEFEKPAKIVAMVSKQGTACAETALHESEDTPAARHALEDQFCHGNSDDPIAGSWTDASGNEAIQALFERD